MITKKDLPNGSVSSSSIKDKDARDAIRRLNENVIVLQEQVRALQNFIISERKV